jgi:hypothetical protein
MGARPERRIPDLVRPFARRVLGRLDLLPSLAVQDADKPAYDLLLPASGLSPSGQRGALRALHHADDFGLLVGAVGLRLARWLLGAPYVLRGFGFLALQRSCSAAAGSGVAFTELIAFSLI